MKKYFIFLIAIFVFAGSSFAQVGINNDNSAPDSSAMLDVKSTNQGFLPPRLSTSQRTSIQNPAQGLLIFNTTTNTYDVYQGNSWKSLSFKDKIYEIGNNSITPWIVSDTTDIFTTYDGMWKPLIYLPIPSYSNNYLFKRINTFLLIRCRSSFSFSISKDYTDSNADITLNNGQSALFVFDGDKWLKASVSDEVPSISTSSIASISQTTAMTGGNVISSAGYTVTAKGVCYGIQQLPTVELNLKTNNGTGLGNFTSSLTGLLPGTTYYVRAYATTNNGIYYGYQRSFTTLSLPCGIDFSVNHVAGLVAPVSKTVTYSAVSNIPGEPTKCWITSNLGSDHQATSVDDATEASAGWYWQFNRMQGYKHDGMTRIPSTTWITSISENSDWLNTNDPCNLELGSQWHLPTYTEWYNVDNIGGWNNRNGPWGSGLKLHAAGYLNYIDGSLGSRGSFGYYWSRTLFNTDNGWHLSFGSGGSGTYYLTTAYGFSARCLRDN